MKSPKYRIIRKSFKTTDEVFFAQVRHPWFEFWFYLGKYTDRLFLTSINDRQVTYNSIDDAYLRIEDHKEFKQRIKETVYSNRCICRYL